jgi:hypothetical protein
MAFIDKRFCQEKKNDIPFRLKEKIKYQQSIYDKYLWLYPSRGYRKKIQ